MKVLEQLVHQLADTLHDTRSVRHISETLEEILANDSFRLHAHSIVTDPNLSESQKKTQLMYLIRTLDVPELYTFFSEELNEENLWLFSHDQIDHLDNFVNQFQMITEEFKVVDITTAIPLSEQDLDKISQDLEKTMGSKVLVNHEINPKLMGGAIIHAENLIYDYSLRTRFQQFERNWLASIVETGKLTGRYDLND